MGELLLELLSEEIPARMQRRAIDDLTALIGDKLATAEIPATTLRGYVTPRRLTVISHGIPGRQPDRTEERRGPRVGAPQQAIDGFLRAAGLASIEQCEVRDTGRGEFYFAVLQQPGRPAAEVLPELLYAAIAELPWPKSMRYPAAALRWVRPLVSVICLLDETVLPLPLDRVPVGRMTRGHRFLSHGEITVENAADYLPKLESAQVVLDHERRRQMIATELAERASRAGLKVKGDPGLLDEVSGLVEYPEVLMGAIDDESMALPPEVLATAMRTHQKYFSCVHPDETPAPHFLFVANNKTSDGGRTIVAGNERVLRARLADARFFWDQDRKIPLASRVGALADRVYHARLGSVRDKVRRMEALSGFLAQQIAAPPTVAPTQARVQSNHSEALALDPRFRENDAEKLMALAQRAAYLAKADLSTGMVGEFPELQGVMGRYYALHDAEDPRVADAIADHYKPQGPNDACPTAPVSVIMALADKIDSLTAFFAIDEKPTGSRDPFALRRAALGIIRLVLEAELRLSLAAAFQRAIELLEKNRPGLVNELVAFIADRLKVHLREQGVRHDLITATFEYRPVRFMEVTMFGFSGRDDDLVRLLKRVDALSRFLTTDDGSNLLTAYRRAANILRIEERRDSKLYMGRDPSSDLFRLPEEKMLDTALSKAVTRAQDAFETEDFEETMAAMAALRRPVDEFFDKVTVNTDDPELRENRLRLLSRIRAVMNLVADFSQIEG